MKDLIRYELRKLCRRKLFVGVLLLLLLLHTILMNQRIPSAKVQSEKALSAFSEAYQQDPMGMETYMADYETLYQAFLVGKAKESPQNIYSENDRIMFQRFRSIQDLGATHQDLLQKAKLAAESMLMEYRYLGYDEHSFEFMYQTSVMESYKKSAQLTFPLDNLTGFDLYFDDDSGSPFLLFGTVWIGMWLFASEITANGMLLRTAKRGRWCTALSKCVTGFLLTSLFCILLSGCSFLVIFFRVGFHGWTLPIQMVDAMQLSPFLITVGEGVILRLLFQMLTMLSFLMLVMGLTAFFKHFLWTLTGILLFIGGNYLLFSHLYFDGYSFARNINLFWCLKGTNFLIRFTGVRVFERCVDGIVLWIIVYGMGMLLGFALTGLLFCGRGSICRVPRHSIFHLPIKSSGPPHYPMGLFRFELKKMRSPFTAVVLFLGMLLLLFLSDKIYHIDRSFEMQYYSSYLSELEGEWTEAKHRIIEADYQNMRKILEKEKTARQQFTMGMISAEEFHSFLNESLSASMEKAMLTRLYHRSLYLQEKHAMGYAAVYFDDSGWIRYRETNLALIPCLAIIFVISDIFSRERRSGVKQIQMPAKKGRAAMVRTKLLTAVGMAILFGLFAEVTELVFAQIFWGLDGAEYSAVSMEIGVTLRVGDYFIGMMIKRLLLYAALALMTTGLSALTKRLLPTLLGMTAFVMVPFVLADFGIPLLESISFINLFVR